MNVCEELFCLLFAFIISSVYIYSFPSRIETGVIKDTNVIDPHDSSYKSYKNVYDTDMN